MSTTTPTPTGRPNARLLQTVGDMVRSIAVVLAVVGVILFLSHRAQPDPVREVSMTNPLIVAQISAGFPVLVPEATKGYRLTSARFEKGEPGVWHLGYVTPQDAYVQLEQSATSDLGFISDQLTGAARTGSQTIGSAAWVAYEGQDNRALVRTADGVTTAVSGTAPMAELAKVAGSLTAPRKAQ